MGLTEVEQYATHPVDTILQRENQVPGTNDRIDTLSIVWGPNSWGMKIGLHEKQKMLKLVVVLQRLNILVVNPQGKLSWFIPSDQLGDKIVESEVDKSIESILTVIRQHPTNFWDVSDVSPFNVVVWQHLNLSLVAGPSFAASSPPEGHERKVARFYWFLSIVIWKFLCHHDDILLQKPRKATSFAHTSIGRRRKPDIVLLHRVNEECETPEWSQIACIGEANLKYDQRMDLRGAAVRYVIDQNWFLMISSYSRRFCLGFTQCGPLFSIYLTDRGGNSTKVDLDVTHKGQVHLFLQAIAHLTLAPNVDIGDDCNFPTFGGSYQMTFPRAEDPLKSLMIQSRLFHTFSSGKGTQIFLAIPDTPVDGTKYVVVKDSWSTLAETHEGYYVMHIRAFLEDSGKDYGVSKQDFPEVLHEHFCKSEHPLNGQLVHEATYVRREVAVIESQNMRLEDTFERRLHYRLVFKDIVVDSTWFASRKEYFNCVLKNLKAHKFAYDVARVLHKDITPYNQWMVIDDATVDMAVPAWNDSTPPPSRAPQLGDFGLAFKEHGSCSPLTFEPETTTPVPSVDGGGTSWSMKVVSDAASAASEVKPKDKPYVVMGRSGCPIFMSNALLADPFGQAIVHTVKHDLEAFWWSIFFVVVNCEGPYGQLVDWESRFQRRAKAGPMLDDPFDPLGEPASWLRNGFQNITYQDILTHRLTSLGNWMYYKHLVHPFWRDGAIYRGLKELFHIFMPVNLMKDDDDSSEWSYDPNKLEDADFFPHFLLNDDAVNVNHDKMIAIIQDILDHMTIEPPPTPEVFANAQKRYDMILKHDLITPFYSDGAAYGGQAIDECFIETRSKPLTASSA